MTTITAFCSVARSVLCDLVFGACLVSPDNHQMLSPTVCPLVSEISQKSASELFWIGSFVVMNCRSTVAKHVGGTQNILSSQKKLT